MISQADVGKLLSIRATEASVLSLFIQVPMDPHAQRGLPARAEELVALAARGRPDDPAAVRVAEGDRRAVRTMLQARARDWAGHTVAIFACDQAGLAEAISLPCRLQERAVLAARPHVRPLLLALQRCPPHYVVVVDRRHAWVLNVAGDRIETVARPEGDSVRSRSFGGWYGLDSHRINERVIQLARHHYRDTAAILDHAMRDTGPQPLVVGGHEEGIPQLIGEFPAAVRDRFAGSFTADTHRMTPARARELARPVIERSVSAREQHLVAQLLESPDRLRAVGLRACLAAVNEQAVRLLLIPAGGVIPGFGCQRCGKLSSTGAECPDGGAASWPVPDLIEEMTTRTMADGGEAAAVQNPPGAVAAQLRFPLALAEQA